MNSEIFADSYFSCKECGQEFCWSAKDKRFMNDCVENQTPNPINGSVIKEVIPPKRCVECRRKRKAYFNDQKNKIKN